MNEIMEGVFKPKIKEICSFDEALEILAFGYYPVDDENLLDENRVKHEHFYYGLDYKNVKTNWGMREFCLGYSKNKDKYYINFPKYRYCIEAEELDDYRKLQKSLAILKKIISYKSSEIIVSYFNPDKFEEIEVDISDVRNVTTKTVWNDVFNKYINEVYGNLYGEEEELTIKFKTKYILSYYNKKVEMENDNRIDIQVPLDKNSNSVINDSIYTTPEIQLINAFIGNPGNIPLLSQRGEKNIDEVKNRLIKLNNKLGLIAKLTDNRINGILSVIKSPEAKKAGTIPTPGNDSF